jgi:hypothetical protein
MPTFTLRNGREIYPNEVEVLVARHHAKTVGDRGYGGGWIEDKHGRTLTQGWASYYLRFRTSILDQITRDLTAYPNFAVLLVSPAAPTIRHTKTDKRAWLLALEYNEYQQRAGRALRAFTGETTR